MKHSIQIVDTHFSNPKGAPQVNLRFSAKTDNNLKDLYIGVIPFLQQKIPVGFPAGQSCIASPLLT
jgi:hypothetical protein